MYQYLATEPASFNVLSFVFANYENLGFVPSPIRRIAYTPTPLVGTLMPKIKIIH